MNLKITSSSEKPANKCPCWFTYYLTLFFPSNKSKYRKIYLLSGLASKQVFNAYFYSFVPALNLLLFYYDLGCRSTYLHIYLFKMGPIMKGIVSNISHIMIVFELLAIFKAVLVPYQKSIFLSLLALCIG